MFFESKRPAFGRIYPHWVAVSPVPSKWESVHAIIPDWLRRLGSIPLGTFAAQGTFSLTATCRRDCGRQIDFVNPYDNKRK